jgi:hypothetical protein
LAGQALQCVLAPVVEPDAGAGDQVPYRARHQHLVGNRLRGDPGAGVDRDAADLAADHLALARVHPGSDGDPERPDLVEDRPSAADGARGAVEAREEAVAGRVDLAPAEAHELAAGDRVVAVHEVAPAPVAEPRRVLRRAHDVDEHDRGEDAVGLARLTHAGQELPYLGEDVLEVLGEEEVVDARELDVLGAPRVLGQVATVLGAGERVAGTVEDEHGGASVS